LTPERSEFRLSAETVTTKQLLERMQRSLRGAAGYLAALAAIGLVDYLTGSEIMFSVFYLLVIGGATWRLGRGFGLALSVLSVMVWVGGDLAAGARYSNPLIHVWNALILLVFYCVVVWLLASLRSLHLELEARVEQRTQALRREMAERQRLEESILQRGEREQRQMGHDLHDNLCQHLTATALAGQVLEERLAARSLPEAADATKIVALVEEGIDLARNVARGLYPVEMEAEGLMTAFRELARQRSQGRCGVTTRKKRRSARAGVCARRTMRFVGEAETCCQACQLVDEREVLYWMV
jgi:signal transduction histidine kinase